MYVVAALVYKLASAAKEKVKMFILGESYFPAPVPLRRQVHVGAEAACTVCHWTITPNALGKCDDCIRLASWLKQCTPHIYMQNK
jgi:hypothetical protein